MYCSNCMTLLEYYKYKIFSQFHLRKELINDILVVPLCLHKPAGEYLALSLKSLPPPLLDLQISRLCGFLLAAVLLWPWISPQALEGRTLPVITVWYRVTWGRHQLGICSRCT